MMTRDYYTTADLVSLLGKSVETIRRILKDAGVPHWELCEWKVTREEMNDLVWPYLAPSNRPASKAQPKHVEGQEPLFHIEVKPHEGRRFCLRKGKEKAKPIVHEAPVLQPLFEIPPVVTDNPGSHASS
jgi:hypothetical protein